MRPIGCIRHIFKRLGKKSLIGLITLILVILPTLILILMNAKGVEAAWADEDWGYRKSIAITAHTASENNVYISTTISNTNTLVTNGQLQSDCGDLRFTRQNGEVLPYYIVSGCNSVSTVVHINFNTFPAGAQTIYLYYGNPSVYNGFRSADFSTEATGYTIGSTGSEEKAPAPVAYWKFDEGTGTTAKDSTTNANNGTLGGTTIPTWQTEDQCISGKCLYFDGSTSKVTGSKVALGVQTVALWVRPNTLNATTPLIDLDGGTHKITVNASGTVTATGFTSPTIYVNGLSGGTVNPNRWNLVEITTGTGFNSTATFTLATDGTNYTKGFFDEVKLYNYARSAAQIQADYNSRANNEGASSTLGASSWSGAIGSTLSNGLVGYWKMDESSGNLVDSSGNGNAGTPTGTTVGAGKYGNGRTFNGTSDYVDIGTFTGLPTTNITVSSWIKIGLNKNWNRIINHSWAAGSGTWLLFSDSTGTTNFGVYSGGVQYNASYAGLSTNTWYHVVGTYDGTKVKIFVNGTEGTSVNLPNQILDTGSGIDIGGKNGDRFNGTIDETRVYNRALSGAEVSQLYNFAPGPVASYNFEEGSGTTVNDKSGNSNTGTWNGTGSQHWKIGKFGTSGNFNGSDDYVSISDSSILTSNNITLQAWVNPSVSAANKMVAAKRASSFEYQLLVDSGTPIFTIFNAGTGTGTSATATTTIPLNTWSHITGSYDGSVVKIYINGVLSASANSTYVMSDTTSPLYIGIENTSSTTRYFNGQIDQVKLYNYARTQQQIIEDMTNGSDVGGSGYVSANSSTGGSIAKPVGYWKFDEGYGTTANNYGNGGSALNGTLTNMSSPATSTSGWTQSGKVGKALVFDGTDDYVNIGAPTALTDLPNNDFTVSAWIYDTKGTGWGHIAGSYSGTDRWLFRTIDSGGNRYLRFSLGFSTTAAVYESAIGTIPANTWIYVTAVWKASSKSAKLYINGQEPSYQTQTAGSGTYAGDSGINKQIGGNSNTLQWFKGSIDEVKIYNFALTADQVKLDMNQGVSQVIGAAGNNSSYQPQAANQEYCIPGDSTSCAAPVGRWDFDEGTGTTVNDSSGNANTGTWNGTGSHWKPGKVNKAGNFNGTDDYVELNDNLQQTSGLTIEAWINTSLASTQQAIVERNQGYGLRVSSTGKLTAVLKTTNQGWNFAATSSQTLPLNSWVHVVTTYTSGNNILYINGVADGTSSTYTGNLAYVAGQTLRIGGWSLDNNARFQGKIDQVRIFNYARTAAQVAWDYNKGAPVGWWKFDECQGTVANDASGNGNTGTITIGASGTQTTAGTCTDGSSASAWNNGKTGKKNYSLNFDGTDDYIDAAAASFMNNASSGTFAAWINPATIGGTAYSTVRNVIFGKASTSDNAFGFSDTTNKLRLRLGNVTNLDSTSIINTGQWTHVVGTWDASGMKIYINGILNNSNSTTVTWFNSAYNTLIGRMYTGSGGTNGSFSGQIDDARVYNYPLTATQIKTLFNEGAYRVGPTTGAP